MAIHISITPEAEVELKRTARRSRMSAVAVSLLCCFLGGVTLFLMVRLFVESEGPAKRDGFFHTEDARPAETPKMVRKTVSRASMASQVAPPVVVAVTAGSVQINPVDIVTDQMDFGMSPVFGTGIGPGLTQFGDSGPGDHPLGTEDPDGGGSALEGTFYDLKQTPSGAPTGMNPGLCKQVLSEFNSSGWNKSMLAKYYQAPTKLYAPCFYMPICKAEEAPYAYKVQDKVKASMWVAIYRGKVKAPKSGRFRFVGLGDDSLAVRFNGKTVFDYGWSSVATGKMLGSNAANRAELKDSKGQPRQFFRYNGAGSDWNNNLDGLSTGDVFEVKEGQSYPIEILISEVPGGYFGFVLLIEDLDDAPKKRDAGGSPIFQLFRMNFAEPNTQEIYKNMQVPGDRRSDVPYDKDSMIWEATV